MDSNSRVYDDRYGPVGSTSALNPILGLNHTHGQCLGFFTEFQKCYITSDTPAVDCRSWREDYTECKLHTKEKARLKRINDERVKKGL